MKIAINYPDARVGPDGHVADHDAGSTLVRRLLRIFPGSTLDRRRPSSCVGFAVRPLELVDPCRDRRDQHGGARVHEHLADPGSLADASRRS